MIVEYRTYTNGQKSYEINIELEHELEFYDTYEGTMWLKRKISGIINLPVDEFSLGNIKEF